MPKTDAERFWEKVSKTDDCWLWTASTIRGGYGLFWHRVDHKNVPAHRVAWEMHHGPIPAGLWVLHRCDTPPCVRVDHLFIGTHADNVADKVAKNRQWRGEQHHLAKLTDKQVAAIRADTRTSSEVARTYGIDSSYVRKLRSLHARRS